MALRSNTISGGAVVGDGEQPVPAYIQALLEQTADNLENLQRTLARGEDSRIDGTVNLPIDGKPCWPDRNDAPQQDLLLKLAQGNPLEPLLSAMAEANQSGIDGTELMAALRNIETHLERLPADQTAGREEAVQDVRNEIRLARTIAALAEGEDPR